MDHWTAPEWARNAILYEIFPERFCNGNITNDPDETVSWESEPTRENFLGGDLQGITSRLDYLRELGVTTLYLTPFFKANTNHRYDTCDYLAIDPAAGSEDDFDELIAELKTRNMNLVLDAVFNHCGDGFWAFQDVVQHGEASPYKDWFDIKSFPISTDPPNYQTCGGTPLLPKLNTNNPEVQAYLLNVTEHWLKKGADGWRLDVPWKVSMPFWRAMRERALTAKPDAYLVAEEWRSAQPWLGGDTVHGVMNYQLRNAILDFCLLDHMDAEDFDVELTRLRQAHGSTAPFNLTLLGSHDTPRILTLCGQNVARAILAVVFQITYVGIPMIYYGDEVGMLGDNDPGCRAGMIWEQERQNLTLKQIYKTLIALRRKNPALTHGDFESLVVFNGLYAYRRTFEKDSVIVILNPRCTQYDIKIEAQWHERWVDVLTGVQYQTDDNQLHFLEIPGQSAIVLTPIDRM